MKKILVFAVTALVILSITGCGKKAETPPPARQSVSDAPRVSENTPPPSPSDSGATTVITPSFDSVNTPEYDAEEVREEAAAVYEQFYNAVKIMDGDAKYDNLFLMYTANVGFHAPIYEKFTDGTEEDWHSMSLFERFIWWETYLSSVNYLYLGDYDRLFSSEANYLKNAYNNTTTMIQRIAGDEMRDAFVGMLKWQYNYIISNGSPYNFMTGMSYLESKNDE